VVGSVVYPVGPILCLFLLVFAFFFVFGFLRVRMVVVCVRGALSAKEHYKEPERQGRSSLLFSRGWMLAETSSREAYESPCASRIVYRRGA
jgi:hypothetical protein